jgi:hypothetical protein
MSLGDWYLNGTKLCPWNFKWGESKEVIGEDTRLLDGSLRRDVVARKLSVDMSWEYLPETFDGTYHCYQDLRALGTKSGTVALIRPVGTSTGTESFNVFVSPPSGEVAVRVDSSDVYWNCSINVRQQ